jgi:hypothetical protein
MSPASQLLASRRADRILAIRDPAPGLLQTRGRIRGLWRRCCVEIFLMQLFSCVIGPHRLICIQGVAYEHID